MQTKGAPDHITRNATYALAYGLSPPSPARSLAYDASASYFWAVLGSLDFAAAEPLALIGYARCLRVLVLYRGLARHMSPSCLFSSSGSVVGFWQAWLTQT
jgi:hypothetical protein